MHEIERARELIQKPKRWTKQETEELIALVSMARGVSDDLKSTAALRASIEAIIASRKLSVTANWLALAVVVLAIASIIIAMASIVIAIIGTSK
jgi:hypothetical protein